MYLDKEVDAACFVNGGASWQSACALDFSSLLRRKRERGSGGGTVDRRGSGLHDRRDTGTILYQVNPTKWMHPASTTKIVTLITALDQKEDELDQPLKISSYAANTELLRWALRRAIS